MGAFFSVSEAGIWATNIDRDDFLEWFAEHRCINGDGRHEWCLDDGQRYSGRCIELSELLQSDEAFEVSADETAEASLKYGAQMGKLLLLIAQLRRGDWKHGADSPEAIRWRD